MASLMIVFASLPLLYVIQASIDARLSRAADVRQRRRAATRILRSVEREMRAEHIIDSLDWTDADVAECFPND